MFSLDRSHLSEMSKRSPKVSFANDPPFYATSSSSSTCYTRSRKSHVSHKRLSDVSRQSLTEASEDTSENFADISSESTDPNFDDIAAKKSSQLCFGFPKSIAFIISNEFCERFNYFGLRTILVLYLTTKLNYGEETSIMFFHTFTMLVYLFPLVGAIIADSWLGKYQTILILSIVYACGGIVLAMGAVPTLHLPVNAVTIIGLLLIAFGTGGIKPCVAAFGGDQFRLPEQAELLASFFAVFYFAINAGSTISTTITPILRADVHCFGERDCFSLAFGVPAILMLISVVIFVVGKPRYILKPAEGNMIFGIVDCLTQAWAGWLRRDKCKPLRGHWLDYAIEGVGTKMVYETKCLLRILLLYLPLPVFWALFDQQGSRWVFQATRMNGRIFGFNIKPDQMQVVNPLLILVFIPLFDFVIYPLIGKFGIRRPLQKLTLGGMLAAVAFLHAAWIELQIQAQEPSKLDAKSAQLRFYNGMPCRYDFKLSSIMSKTKDAKSYELDALDMWSHSWHNLIAPRIYDFVAYTREPKCAASITGSVQLVPGQTSSYFLANDVLQEFNDADDLRNVRSILGKPVLRTLVNTQHGEGPVVLHDAATMSIDLSQHTLEQSPVGSVSAGQNKIEINGMPAAEFETQNGGVYTIMLQGSQTDGYQSRLVELRAPNSISILWQLPQIITITAAEIMFSVTGLEFSFTQAPASMKSVLQACWLLSVATGNMLVVLMSNLCVVKSRAAEFVLYAGLMFVDMLIFMVLAKRYQYDYQATAATLEQEQQNYYNYDKGRV